MVTVIKRGTSKEKIKSLMMKRSKKQGPHKRVIELEKYCGVINLDSSPGNLQKKWRDEWE